MIPASETFIAKVNEDSRTFRARFRYNGSVIPGDIRAPLTIHKGSCGGEGFTLGDVFTPYVDCTIDYCTVSLENKELELQIGILTNDDLEDPVFDYITMGFFTVVKPMTNARSCTFTGYGRLLTKCSMPYTSALSYPATLQAVVNEIATAAGVTVVVKNNLDLGGSLTDAIDGVMCYEALGIIAELAGGYVTEDNLGNIVLAAYDTTASFVLTDDHVKTSPTFYENDYELDGIKCIVQPATEDDEGEAGTPEIAYTYGTGRYQFQNGYMTQALFNRLVASVIGYTYNPGTVQMSKGDPRLEPWDVIEYTNQADRTYSLPCMQISFIFDGGMQNEITAQGESDTEQDMDTRGPITKAIERTAADANLQAARAKAAADQAAEDAAAVSEILDDMEDAAEAAGTTLTQIYQDAADAARLATAADAAASAAETAASHATTAANGALVGLSQVENVVDVLTWIATHGEYEKTADQTVVSGKTYYTVTATAVTTPVSDELATYYELVSGAYTKTSDTAIVSGKTYYTVVGTPVATPEAASLNTYYELTVDDAVSNYVQAHLALTDDGLYVMADESEWKVLIANDGVYIIDNLGKIVASYSDTVIIGDPDGINYLTLTKNIMDMIINQTTSVFRVGVYSGDTTEVINRYVNDLHWQYDSRALFLDSHITDGTITLEMRFSSTLAADTYTETVTFTAGTSETKQCFVYNDPTEGAQRIQVQYNGDYTITMVDMYTYQNTVITIESIVTYNVTNSNGLSAFFTFGIRQQDHIPGDFSVAEGYQIRAQGNASHAEGKWTRANGDQSHAQNLGTKASSPNQTAIGKYNEDDTNGTYAFIIGNGTADANASRSNAFTVDWSGNVEAAGVIEDGLGNVLADKVDMTTPEYNLNISATSGTTDGDLYAAITALGWESEVID